MLIEISVFLAASMASLGLVFWGIQPGGAIPITAKMILLGVVTLLFVCFRSDITDWRYDVFLPVKISSVLGSLAILYSAFLLVDRPALIRVVAPALFGLNIVEAIVLAFSRQNYINGVTGMIVLVTMSVAIFVRPADYRIVRLPLRYFYDTDRLWIVLYTTWNMMVVYQHSQEFQTFHIVFGLMIPLVVGLVWTEAWLALRSFCLGISFFTTNALISIFGFETADRFMLVSALPDAFKPATMTCELLILALGIVCLWRSVTDARSVLFLGLQRTGLGWPVKTPA